MNRVTRSLQMLIVSFFWAIGHPLGRIITQKMHPFQLAGITLIAGFFSLFIYLVIKGDVKKIFKLPIRDILISLGLGVVGFFLYQIYIQCTIKNTCSPSMRFLFPPMLFLLQFCQLSFLKNE